MGITIARSFGRGIVITAIAGTITGGTAAKFITGVIIAKSELIA
jgi:hypothetical protein